jgi:hypothetical protein
LSGEGLGKRCNAFISSHETSGEYRDSVGFQTFTEFSIPATGLALHLVAGNNRFGFVIGRGLDAIGINALLYQVVFHGVRTAPRQALIVRIGTDAVGVTGYENQFDLCIALQLANNLIVEFFPAFGAYDRFIELEQCDGLQGG